jgi:hypothetical protein
MIFIGLNNAKSLDKTLNLESNVFKGIDLACIDFLNKKLHSLLKNYTTNNQISCSAILEKNLSKLKPLNSKEVNLFIKKYYPEIFMMDKGLDQDIESTLEDINDTKMDFGDKVYS